MCGTQNIDDIVFFILLYLPHAFFYFHYFIPIPTNTTRLHETGCHNIFSFPVGCFTSDTVVKYVHR